MKGNDRAVRPTGKATIASGLSASQKICSVEELERLPADTKPRTSHHNIDRLEERGVKG